MVPISSLPKLYITLLRYRIRNVTPRVNVNPGLWRAARYIHLIFTVNNPVLGTLGPGPRLTLILD